MRPPAIDADEAERERGHTRRAPGQSGWRDDRRRRLSPLAANAPTIAADDLAGASLGAAEGEDRRARAADRAPERAGVQRGLDDTRRSRG